MALKSILKVECTFEVQAGTYVAPGVLMEVEVGVAGGHRLEGVCHELGRKGVRKALRK